MCLHNKLIKSYVKYVRLKITIYYNVNVLFILVNIIVHVV